MKSMKCSLAVAATAMALVGCSETADTENLLGAQIVTCADGSVVQDAALCPFGAVASSSDMANALGSGLVGSSSSVVSAGPSGVPSIDADGDTDLEDAKTLDGTEILITMAGTTATIQNDNGCLQLEEKSVTISCPGDYYFTGSSTDFQVVVNTPGTEGEGNTGIYLYNASIKSSDSPILVKNADKTVLHLVKGTVNSVEDGLGAHVFTKINGEQDTSKAAIYARDDLNIKGAGTLTVTANFRNGIQSSNDLKIKNGDITVIAAENGVKGKGSIVVSGGTLNVSAAAGDGLESDECVVDAADSCTAIVEGKGLIVISGGSVNIIAGDDGIQAYNYILVSDSLANPVINVTSTGKGFVADNMLYMNGGTVAVSATDDGLHSGVNVYMNKGSVTISSKDDGIHADSTLYLNGSTVNVVTAYEGMEAYMIRAQAGITSTYATDDGWNAAGGAKENMAGAGITAMLSTSSGHIVVSGGYHYIGAAGPMIDVLDANGTAKQTGGVLILEITGESYESGLTGGDMGEFNPGDFNPGDFNFGDSAGGFNPGNFNPGDSAGGFNPGDFNFGDSAGGFNPGNFNFGDSAGGFNPGNFNPGSMSGEGGTCSSNIPGGLIDTDAGFEITGGILLAFGDYTESIPKCDVISFTNENFYGSEVAAFKPEYHGSMILYGGDVASVGVVDVSGMNSITFPNGKVFMYR